jgi:cytochrome bd ubiquinol oxidase subunit II
MQYLEVLWYLVVVVSVIMYAVLDGFDLGVGCLLPFAKKDRERRLFLNSIGPIWDGNEVWLVIVGGALFAGFPNVFATVFSASYDFVMLLLAGLIFRAVSIEFRSKRESPSWRKTWDVIFFLSSFTIAFGVGLVLGNLIQGIPIDSEGNFVGTALTFIRPYPILFGITTVALFMMHGSIYLTMKISGTFHEAIRPWIKKCIFSFIACYLLLSISTFWAAPHMTERMMANPWFLAVPLLAFLAILNVPRLVHKRSDGWAFIFSCLSIAFLLLLFPLGTYPIILRSSIDHDAYSLTVTNSASSPLTLKILLTIVLIGIPLVIAYGAYIYHVFRGKVKLEPNSY